MKMLTNCGKLISQLILACCVITTPAAAQNITTDDTLNTVVSTSTDGTAFTITVGERTGNNLFHSFKDFSIPEGSTATFSNAADVTNIISRVTGGRASNIDGTIKTSGTANLFLLNSNGIVFGPGAQLSVGGSFVGSTAESLRFSDGTEFSAIATTPSPLLTVSTPKGLQFGAASSNIRMTGTGHEIVRSQTTGILSVEGTSSRLSLNPTPLQPGRTLALIGNGVSIEGGRISTIAGQIELGSISSGRVDFAVTPVGITAFDYTAVDQFENIDIVQGLVDAISPGGGLIHLQGRNILLEAGGKVFIQNQAPFPSGGIFIDVSESLKILGNDPTRANNSAISTDSLLGDSGDIVVSARDVMFAGGNGIDSVSILAPGGDISVTATNSIDIQSVSSNAGFNTGIDTSAFGPDYVSFPAGDLTITTNRLRLSGGATATSISYAVGDSGDVEVNAQSIELTGIEPVSRFPSLISAGTLGSGNSGNVVINTQRLALSEGGRVDSSTANTGNAGSVTINATESVSVDGLFPGSINPSLIISGANLLDEALKVRYDLPPVPTGDSGDLTITTPILSVSNSAQVTVRNDGTGSGGTLRTRTTETRLNNSARISASTVSGTGGDLDLQSSELMLLTNGSILSTEAGGTGDGGNITIESPFLLAVENSDIIANAFQGDGGNIEIASQSILGTASRDQLTVESDITASSQFGTSGTVNIINLTVDPSSGAVALPENVNDPSQQVTAACAKEQNNQFVASGRGGLPISPNIRTAYTRIWNDVREIPGHLQPPLVNPTTTVSEAVLPETVVEAVGWSTNGQGEVSLMAARDSDRTHFFNAANCLNRSTELPT